MSLLDQIRTSDWNDPGRWPPTLRAAVVAATLAAVIVLGARVFAVNVQYALLRSAEREEVELRARFEQGQGRAANLDAYREQLAEIERSYGTLLGRLPGTTGIPGLLADVSQAGLSAGLEEQRFQPLEEVSREFYAELPIRMRLSGDYHQFGRFVSDIATISRLVTMHDIHIRPMDDGEPGELVLDLTVRAYRHPDEEGGLP